MKRLVILEDEKNIRVSLRMFLEREGFIVEDFADPILALPMLITIPPDLLILDGRMKGMHGIDVYLKFRNFSLAPVIFISAYAEEIEEHLRERGTPATAYVSKPFSLRTLSDLVQSSIT